MYELDPRLLEVVVDIGGNIHRFGGELAIKVQGTRYANPLQDTAQVTIFNMDRATQDYILNITSPYTANHFPKSVTILAGRQSYGTTLIYKGSVLSSVATQPPDIGVTLNLMSGPTFQTFAYSTTQSGLVSLEEITAQIAVQANAQHQFQVDNPPMIANYGFAGNVIQEIAYVNTFGNISIFMTEGITNTLTVLGATVAIRDSLRIVSEETGMIGIPVFTELGIRVIFFIDNKTKLGGQLRVISKRYPAFNGDYVIYKLNFDLANRDTPFYYIAEAARRNLNE